MLRGVVFYFIRCAQTVNLGFCQIAARGVQQGQIGLQAGVEFGRGGGTALNLRRGPDGLAVDILGDAQACSVEGYFGSGRPA